MTNSPLATDSVIGDVLDNVTRGSFNSEPQHFTASLSAGSDALKRSNLTVSPYFRETIL